MFKINATTKQIGITRGDVGTLEVQAASSDGANYTFRVGDIVRFKVYKNQDCGCVEIQKDIEIAEDTTKALIRIEAEDTKKIPLINKPAIYWYEIELNPETNPQTIIGYDETGAKVFMLYPEGGDSK